MFPKVSLVVLNWNGLENTIECLESLQKITYANYEVIVVDNGSAGNDAQVLRERFGGYAHIIQNDRNYGYTGGNNIGMRHALSNSSPDYFLILNNDVDVAPDFLTEMVNVAEGDDSIGIVGPKVYYYDFPNIIQSAGCRIGMRRGISTSIGNKEIDNGQYDAVREMDHVMGCCLLIKREVVEKVGMFDESYFCYWDEVDYCTRARKTGYKVIYAPKARMWHKKRLRAKLWAKLWAKISMEQQATASSYYYWARNNFRFMRKHASKSQYRSFLLYYFGFQFWFTSALCLLHHHSLSQFVAFLRGAKDGL